MSVRYINHGELKRSLMLLRAANIPACIIGGVGCGKTTAVEDLVKEIDGQMSSKYNIWKILLGLVDPTEVGGIPMRSDNMEIVYAPPSFLPYNCDDEGIILGDEYDRSSPETQNAFNQILLGGEIHGNKISKNAYVVLTMNGSSDKYTTQLTEATRTRVCTLFLSSKAASSLTMWDEWAAKNEINDTIRAFAHFRNDLIQTHEEFDEMAMITPRTRDMAGRVLDAAKKMNFKTEDIMMPVLSGIIGQMAAVELIAFDRMREQLPDIQDMVKHPHNYELHACWEAPDMCYAVGLAIAGCLDDEDLDKAENAITLISYMPDEIGAWAIRNVTNKCPPVMTTDAFRTFFDGIKDLI